MLVFGIMDMFEMFGGVTSLIVRRAVTTDTPTLMSLLRLLVMLHMKVTLPFCVGVNV